MPKSIQSEVKNHQAPSVTVRELLKRFNAQRRGIHVVNKIRSALSAYQLETIPDFEGEYIDSLIAFRRAQQEPEDATPKTGLVVPSPDVAFRIGKLTPRTEPLLL